MRRRAFLGFTGLASLANIWRTATTDRPDGWRCVVCGEKIHMESVAYLSISAPPEYENNHICPKCGGTVAVRTIA